MEELLIAPPFIDMAAPDISTVSGYGKNLVLPDAQHKAHGNGLSPRVIGFKPTDMRNRFNSGKMGKKKRA